MIYALDTNIISYYLRGEGKVGAYFQQEIQDKGNIYAIAHFCAYEIRRWLNYKPTQTMRLYATQFEQLFQNVYNLADVPAPVWEKATEIYIELQSKGQLIGDADILIAAYCLVNDYTLVTRNHKDFQRITGLQQVDWYA